jgi:NADPH:quinone reductase-like Zn-dependent oxidoreductase
MRAMVVRRYGPPEVFESQEVPDPQPKAGEVLIRVKAVGINFADLLQRMGLYPGTPKPPFVPGLEIAGVVEKIAGGGKPAEGEPAKQGDAVVAFTQCNAYAEWVSVAVPRVFRLPPGMPFDDAAAIPVNYVTAYHSMFAMGNLQPGDRILIHGAAGGVGIAAVQLARARGLVIFGTAGPSKQEYLRKIGVDHSIDYTKSDFVEVVRKYAPDGIEMVMDPIGGKSFARSEKCLGSTGRLVVYGFSTAAGPGGKRSLLRGLMGLLQMPRFNPLKLMRQNHSVIGVHLGMMQSRGALIRSELDEVFRMYSAGKIRPVI